MVLRLQVENGKIKEYPTFWFCISTEPGVKSTYQTKCGLSFENNPKTMACDHLDCALYAPKMEVIYPSVMLLVFSGIIFSAALGETKNFFFPVNSGAYAILIFLWNISHTSIHFAIQEMVRIE